jgi:hypothetical protein
VPSSTSSSRRLTASDRPGVAQPVPVRDVPELPWPSMLLGAVLLAVALTGAWEWHWRAYGAVPGIRDDDALWARERRRIDEGEGNATVLVGASRTFFDLQLPVWERLSGRRPIQLALNGTSPLFALEDLANDPKFTGRLLIGVAPDVFFSGYEYRKNLARYFHKESPSERVGKILSMHLIEPWLAFYDPDFALFTVLRRQPWPEREGLSGLQVRKLSITEADRNNYMWSKLETDATYRALARSIWEEDFNDPPPTAEEAAKNRQTLDDQIQRTAAVVMRLRARKIPVFFVREPSAGEYLAYENRDFPRKSTWDVLIEKAGAPGIHFQDYPQLQGYDLPEWSHMTRASAERYTEALYRIIVADRSSAIAAPW